MLWVVRSQERRKLIEVSAHKWERFIPWARQLLILVVHTLAGHADIKTIWKYYLAVRPEDFDSTSEVLNLVLSKTQSV
jgi:hypothetical protein